MYVALRGLHPIHPNAIGLISGPVYFMEIALDCECFLMLILSTVNGDILTE